MGFYKLLGEDLIRIDAFYSLMFNVKGQIVEQSNLN